MKYVLVISLQLLSLYAVSQGSMVGDCSKEVLKNKAGTWKQGIKGSVAGVTTADLAKERTVTAAIHKMVSSKYQPKGCQVLYSSSFGKTVAEGERWVADPYAYSMYILRYLCDPNSSDKSKYYVDYSTPTTVNIAANVIFCFNTLYGTNLSEDDMRGYLKMKQRPVLKDGFYFLGEEVVGDGHLQNKIKEYRWLITYNDSLPFYYVSRKEYLIIQKKRLDQTLKNSPSESKYLEKYFKNISDYLKKPESELALPAICMWNEEERFEGFVEEGTRGSFIAVKPNPDYYHKKLSAAAPQFFTVVYKIAHGDPVFEDNIANIQKAVDFNLLRNMLGK